MRRPPNKLSFGNVFLACLLFIATSSSAQNMLRQSMGDMSSFKTSSNLHVQQSVGQVYPIYSISQDKTYYNPGFIQPGFKAHQVPSIPTHLSLYPNPTQSQFRVSSDRMMQQVRISVTDLNGREIFGKELTEFQSIDINCSEWAKGLYLVNIIEYGLGTYTSKVIISE